MGAGTARFVDQAFEQIVGALRSFTIKDCRQGFEPLLGFKGVFVVGSLYGTSLGERGHRVSPVGVRDHTRLFIYSRTLHGSRDHPGYHARHGSGCSIDQLGSAQPAF
ncbi:hypothetical protein D9M68_792940 [compost metagenome]